MGKRGPSRTPLKILEARGSLKKYGRSEPDIAAGAPRMPDGLSDVEQRAWREVCEWLVPVGVVSPADGLALFALVDALSALLEAREDNMPSQRSTARNDLLRACGKFGLTPADRTNVSGGKAPSKDEKSKFFRTG